jgi:hypothetical protein
VKKTDRLLLLALIASAAAGAASLWLAVSEAPTAARSSMFEFLSSANWIAVATAYLGFSAALGFFAPQIGSAVRRFTRKRRVVISHHYLDDDYVTELSKELARYRVL